VFASPDLTIDEVLHAYEKCRRTKRNSEGAIEFEVNFSRNIMAIYHAVRAQTWKPSGHMCFVVENPKPREVWASTFADRVVHHICYHRLRPRFEPYWIATTFACIQGRGTSAASDWAERSARRVTQGWSQPAWLLQADIKNFFPRIHRQTLHDMLAPRIYEPWLASLVDEIINVDVTQNAHFPGDRSLLRIIPRHKSLWHAEPGRGLPIGNLTSQFGANVYLDCMDQRIARSGVARHYGRYVDDIVLMDPDIDNLRAAYRIIVKDLSGLGLELHPDKTRCIPVADGFDFCGRYILPHRTYLRRRTVKRGNQAISNMQGNRHKGETLTSYLALARPCNSRSLRKQWAIRASQHGVVTMRNHTKARAIA